MAKGVSVQERKGEYGVNENRTYRIAFLKMERLRHLAVEGCRGKEAATRTAMGVHLWHRHVQGTVVILEEGNLSHPWCPLCNMLVLW